MTRARSADPLTAATTSILLPALRPLGFQRKSNRLAARIRDDILQFVGPDLSAWGSKDFCMSYGSMPLFRPEEYLVLNYGGRLKAATGGDLWLGSSTHQQADAAMLRFVGLVQAQALPFFESTATAKGLLAYITRSGWGEQHHGVFDRACCMARLGRRRRARTLALRAIKQYREDGRPWCADYIELCEQLVAALEAGATEALLRGWVEDSVRQLKLEKVVEKSSRTSGSS